MWTHAPSPGQPLDDRQGLVAARACGFGDVSEGLVCARREGAVAIELHRGPDPYSRQAQRAWP